MSKKIVAGFLCSCLVFAMLASCKEEKPMEITVDNTISTVAVEKEKASLKVISYNVKDCENGEKIEEIANDIKSKNADVVCVQEIDKMTERSGNRDVIKLLSQQLGLNYCFFPAIELQGGEYGIGILSKYELTNCKRVSLETGREEGRVLAQAQIHVDGKAINVFNTHLSYESLKLRSEQMKFLNETVSAEKPFVLTGDFNIEAFDEYGQLSGVNMVNKKDNQLNSYVGDDGTAFTALDNIICSDELTIVNSEMGKTSASDHNFLFAEIQL